MVEPEEFTMDLPDSVDDAALRRVKAVARVLDEAVRIPGTEFRVGVDTLLSAVPTPVGDAVGAGLSLYIVLEAANLGVPYTTIVRMLGNVALDVGVGAVPVVGTIFDAVWKANKRNVALIERHLERQADRSGRGGRRGRGRRSGRGSSSDPVTIDVEAQD